MNAMQGFAKSLRDEYGGGVIDERRPSSQAGESMKSQSRGRRERRPSGIHISDLPSAADLRREEETDMKSSFGSSCATGGESCAASCATAGCASDTTSTSAPPLPAPRPRLLRPQRRAAAAVV